MEKTSKKQKTGILVINPSEAKIKSEIKNLGSSLKNGEAKTALSSYKELINEIKLQSDISGDTKTDEKYIKSVAREIIEKQLNCNLKDYIETKTSNNAITSYKKILSWGHSDDITQEDLLMEMCNIKKKYKKGNIFVGLLASMISPLTAMYSFVFNC